jgi:hypothetical protein
MENSLTIAMEFGSDFSHTSRLIAYLVDDITLRLSRPGASSLHVLVISEEIEGDNQTTDFHGSKRMT